MVALYPLLAITLRNNLASLLGDTPTFASMNPKTRNYIFTFTASLPMIGVAYAKPDIQLVTSVTGAYFGLAIMFFVPTFLVLAVRKKLEEEGLGQNPHSSEFQSKGWAYFVLIWGALCGLATTVLFGFKIAGVTP
jgi:hypothetical protein